MLQQLLTTLKQCITAKIYSYFKERSDSHCNRGQRELTTKYRVSMKHLEYRTDYYKSDLGYGTEELPFKLSQGCFLKSPI